MNSADASPRPSLNQADLSIIIINWNSVEFLRSCLESISLQTCSPKETIVIDNASFDGVADVLRLEFPDVIFIQSDCNLGFSKANNLAARRASSSLLLFLNPDTELPPTCLEALKDAANQLGNFGILGPVLLNTDGSLQLSAAQAFPTILNQVLDTDILKRHFPMLKLWGMTPFFAKVRSPAECISGACMLISTKLYFQLGGFSERYFMYSEDVDLSFRAAQAGFQNYVVPEARVMHHGGGSSSKRPNTFAVTTMRESRFQFFAFNRGVPYAWCFRVFIGLAAAVRLGILISVSALVSTNETRRLRYSNARIKWKAVLYWALGKQVEAT